MKSSLKIFKMFETLLFFFKQKYISFLETYFLRFLRILGIFFAEADTKKHRYASGKTSNTALVKLTHWIIKNDHVINYALFFYKLFYKNTFYKNTEAQITQKLRTIKEQWPGWMQEPKKTSSVRNRSFQLKLDTQMSNE